jgi:hypothetical protein
VREIREMRQVMAAFEAAVEVGEVAGFKNGSIGSHGGI